MYVFWRALAVAIWKKVCRDLIIIFVAKFFSSLSSCDQHNRVHFCRSAENSLTFARNEIKPGACVCRHKSRTNKHLTLDRLHEWNAGSSRCCCRQKIPTPGQPNGACHPFVAYKCESADQFRINQEEPSKLTLGHLTPQHRSKHLSSLA